MMLALIFLVIKQGLCFVKLYQVDNLMCVLCFPTDAGSKSVNKPRFSLRGYDFIPLDVKTDNLCTGGQEGTSAVPSTKASQTVVAARLENIDEQTEDLEPEFALPTKKANTSVSELLDNLQRRSGSSVRAPSSVCIVLRSCFIIWSSYKTCMLLLNILSSCTSMLHALQSRSRKFHLECHQLKLHKL